jgi:hypothetical protein
MARKKRGRRVARLPAVIAKPCSTVDQMAMSSVAPVVVSVGSRSRYENPLTEEIRRVEIFDKWKTCDDSCARNAAHGNERDQSNLRSSLQLKVPHKETRNDGKGEVGDDAEGAVRIGETNNEAVAHTVVECVVFPESVYRPALKDCNKEKGTASNNGGEHGSVEDPGVNALDTDSEEEESDGEFCEYHRPAVEDVAKPPAMPCPLDIFFAEIPVMASSSVLYSDD